MKNKDNEKILEENWIDIQRRALDPLWDFKFKKMYLAAKLDKDDFYSLAHEELTEAFENYDPKESAVITYAYNVLLRKGLTELRDHTKRDKRKALYTSMSLDAPISVESKVTLGETIECIVEEENSLMSEKRVGKFVSTLSNLQLRVMILLLLNFKKEDMSVMLDVPKHRIKDAFKELLSGDTKRILKGRI